MRDRENQEGNAGAGRQNAAEEGQEKTAELLLKVEVQCGEAFSVSGQDRDIVMIPFSGTAQGPYFNGRILGEGVDVQKIDKNGKRVLSARYMLEGEDFMGQKCRIFIENEGCPGEIYRPLLVTDSQALAGWEKETLWDTVEGIPGGVCVRIYRGRG